MVANDRPFCRKELGRKLSGQSEWLVEEKKEDDRMRSNGGRGAKVERDSLHT